MMNFNDLTGLSLKESIEKSKIIDCLILSERLSEVLFKSKLSEKIKILTIDLCFGSSGVYSDNKFSINIKNEGEIKSDEEEELISLKNKFINITEEYIGDRKSAENLINYFWEVKSSINSGKKNVMQCVESEGNNNNVSNYQVGSKFETIEGNFNHLGSKIKIQHEEGRVMLLDIWATWCGYCVKPMDYNIQISNELKDLPIDFIGVSCDKDNVHKNWVDFIKSKKWISIQQYRNKNIMQLFGLQSIPHVVLVNPKGIITYSGHPNQITNLKETLKSLFITENKEKNNAEDIILTKDDPNPLWLNNSKEEREGLVCAVNDMLSERGISTVKFAVSTKILFHNGLKKSLTQPLFSGHFSQDQFETVQEISLMVSEDFGLNDVKYNMKLTGVNNQNSEIINNIFSLNK